LEELLLQGSRVTGIAQSAWEQFVREGYTVVDATCGNGFDTKWLAEKIGPLGQLVAFDIQVRNSPPCCMCMHASGASAPIPKASRMCSR
jgi:hypothetical protein